MIAARTCHRDAAAGQDIHLFNRLVNQPVTERGRLDAHSAHGAAHRNALQLRRDGGQQTVAQSLANDGIVGRHALHIGGESVRVYREHSVEIAGLEFAAVKLSAMAKEIRGPLAQAHGRTRRHDRS